MSVNRVPPEIWADIFIKYMKDSRYCRSLGPKQAPILFTLVCRKWRATALSTPRLWTNLWLPQPPKQWAPLRLYIIAVKGWLKCSHPLPIRLQVRVLKYMSPTFLRSFISALLEHARRWESVAIFFEGNNSSLTVFDEVDESFFPLLKSFDISDSYGPVSHNLTQALKAAPNLHSVGLNHSILDDSWSLSWSNLSNLWMSISTGVDAVEQRLDMNFFVSAMTACTCLRSLTLSFDVGFAWDDEHTTIMSTVNQATIPSLESLELQMDPDVIAIFAPALILPNLNALTLHTGGEPWNIDDWDVFTDFVLHFHTSLRHLSLNDAQVETDQLADLLILLPRLVQLELRNISRLAHWDVLFMYLWQEPMNLNRRLEELLLVRPQHLGELKSLHEGPHSWGYEKLLEMLKKRRSWPEGGSGSGGADDNGPGDHGCSQLKSLHMLRNDLERMKKESPQEYAGLMQLVDQGLKLSTDHDIGAEDEEDGDAIDDEDVIDED